LWGGLRIKNIAAVFFFSIFASEWPCVQIRIWLSSDI
jgi:hypothetical protein